MLIKELFMFITNTNKNIYLFDTIELFFFFVSIKVIILDYYYYFKTHDLSHIPV